MKLKLRQKRLIVSTTLIIISMLLIIFPKKTAFGAHIGVMNCLEIVVPSLFPFMVITVFLSESGYCNRIFSLPSAILSKITRLNKQVCALFFIGMIGGYQSAAKSIALLCKKKAISPENAATLLCFCTNAGPAFLISAVGSGMFLSSSIGAILFISSILSSFSLMFFYAPKLKGSDILTSSKRNKSLSICFVNSVKESCKATSVMCAFIVLFSVIIYLIPDFPDNLYSLRCIIYGLFEVTSGVAAASIEISLASVIAVSAICGFGGLCIIFQIIAICSDAKIKIMPFIISRLLHAILSAFYTFLLLLTIPIEVKQTFISNASAALPSIISAPLPALMLLICCTTFPLYLTRQKNL